MLGTLLIAVPGYGMATLCALGIISAISDGIKATSEDAKRREANAAITCAILTIAFAGVTRWLLGGAL